jgi:hypothetical protein
VYTSRTIGTHRVSGSSVKDVGSLSRGALLSAADSTKAVLSPTQSQVLDIVVNRHLRHLRHQLLDANQYSMCGLCLSRASRHQLTVPSLCWLGPLQLIWQQVPPPVGVVCSLEIELLVFVSLN